MTQLFVHAEVAAGHHCRLEEPGGQTLVQAPHPLPLGHSHQTRHQSRVLLCGPKLEARGFEALHLQAFLGHVQGVDDDLGRHTRAGAARQTLHIACKNQGGGLESAWSFSPVCWQQWGGYLLIYLFIY